MFCYRGKTPTFETNPVRDFVWLDLWGLVQGKKDGMGYFEGSGLQAQVADMVTRNIFGFAGLNICS